MAELFILWFTRLPLLVVIQRLEGFWLRDTWSMTAAAGGILDKRNTIGAPIFDGPDANWESWRVKFEAHGDLANMRARLDVAAEQTSFITHDGLDTNSVTISKTVHVLVSLVPRRFGLAAWRVFKEGCEGKVEIGQRRSRENVQRGTRPWCHACFLGERRCAGQNCRRRKPPASGGPSRDCHGTRARSLP